MSEVKDRRRNAGPGRGVGRQVLRSGRPRGVQGWGGGEARQRSGGFSIVEVLIAALVVLVISVGVVTLYVQSTRSNLEGNEATRVSNFAKSRVEEFLQLPFDSALLQILAGTERQFDEYYRQATTTLPAEWVDGTLSDAASAGDTALWTRTSVVRQFAREDLTAPLDSATPPGDVDLKEIVVTVSSTRSAGPLGAGKSLALRALKSE